MNIVDLTQARAQRAEDAAHTKVAVDSLYDCAAKVAETYADLAFSVSGPLQEHCRQLAVDINRSQLRRAKLCVRGQIRRLKIGPDGTAAIMTFMDDTFWNCINRLLRERKIAMGRDPDAEATAELLAERKPWPSCFMLKPEDIIAWLDLIHSTGGKLSPGTRVALVKARADLEAGNALDGDAETLIDRLIRVRWKQGHQIEWVSRWAESA